MSEAPTPALMRSDSLISAGAGAAHQMMGIFGAYPVLLSLLIANLATLSLATWFLMQQEAFRHAERIEMIELLKECIGHKP